MAKVWKYISLLVITALALGTALVTAGGSAQVDAAAGPSDNLTDLADQPGLEQAVQQSMCDNSNDGGVIETTDEYILIEVDCWHSGWCPLCGEIDYSCSPAVFCWFSPCPFADPVPRGSIVTRIEAEVRGNPCQGNHSIKVYVNDTLVDEATYEGFCWCGSCNPVTVSSNTYKNGFPGYVYGGENGLGLEMDGTACISDVYVKLYYQKQAEQASRPSRASSTPAQMAIQYLGITPKQTSAGQPITISTNVVNTGGQAGSLNVILKINEKVEQTKLVSVGPQGTQPVKFTITKDQSGTYTVDIGGQKGSFTIIGAGGSTAGTSSSSNLVLIIVVAALVVAAVVVLILVLR